MSGVGVGVGLDEGVDEGVAALTLAEAPLENGARARSEDDVTSGMGGSGDGGDDGEDYDPDELD